MKAWDCLNLVTQVGFDFAFVYLAGPRAMLYLLLSVFLGGGRFVRQELGDLFVGIRGGSDGSRRLFL